MVNLQKVIIHYGERFDSIQLILSDGVKSTYTPLMGGGGGNPIEWLVPANEFLSQVEYWTWDGYVCGLTFLTNKGTKV